MLSILLLLSLLSVMAIVIAVAIIDLLSTCYGLCSLQLMSNSQSNHVKSVLSPYFFIRTVRLEDVK